MSLHREPQRAKPGTKGEKTLVIMDVVELLNLHWCLNCCMQSAALLQGDPQVNGVRGLIIRFMIVIMIMIMMMIMIMIMIMFMIMVMVMIIIMILV